MSRGMSPAQTNTIENVRIEMLLSALKTVTDHFAAVMAGPMISGRGVIFANGVEGIPTIAAARLVIAAEEARKPSDD